MKAILVTIGDEILIGQIIDTNSAWIAEKLNESGIRVQKIISVADDETEIAKGLTEAENQADLIILTGGLGPTKDDITKQCLANFLGTTLELDNIILKQVESYFLKRGQAMPKANKGQALVLKGGIAVANQNGTAPGLWFQKNEKVFISMPGVPYEMKAMMEENFLPMITQHFNTPFIYHKTVLTQGIGESSLMEIIEDWENELLQNQIKLAYLPQPGIVRLRLTGIGNNRFEVKEKVEKAINQLHKIIPNYIWGFNKQTLPEVVGELLKKHQFTLATAESCTGGFIAHNITLIPGCSAYYLGSVVSYHNNAKQGMLEVSEQNLKQFGAVSKQVVEQMALGVKKQFNSDFSVATSGIAGPDGGTTAKPVGTVWIAVATPKKVISEVFNFGTQRELNIRKATWQGLNMLRKAIIELV